MSAQAGHKISAKLIAQNLTHARCVKNNPSLHYFESILTHFVDLNLLLMVTVFAAIVGCLIYVPQFLASVQTMEIVPSFAVGSAVGLRGFMSYIFGASLGTSLFGVMVDKMGWHGGFYLLMGGIVCCILFCYLSHRGALELEQQRKITEQEEARLALADAQ